MIGHKEGRGNISATNENKVFLCVFVNTVTLYLLIQLKPNVVIGWRRLLIPISIFLPFSKYDRILLHD